MILQWDEGREPDLASVLALSSDEGAQGLEFGSHTAPQFGHTQPLNPSGTTSVTIPNDRSRSAGIPNTNAQSWANLQTHYDTEVVREAYASGKPILSC